jgi:hypothetical protein
MRPVGKKLKNVLESSTPIENNIFAEGVLHIFDHVVEGTLLNLFEIKFEVIWPRLTKS